MARKPDARPRGNDGERKPEARVMGADEPVMVDATALATLTRQEYDIQITTAKRYPRSIVAFRREALELATLDEDTAASMGFALPRAGKAIVGPSVRLAEVIAATWGNMRVGTRIVEVGQSHVTAQAVCHDLERNLFVAEETRRRITGRDGKRYNEDMISTTCAAATSIARRNAVFRVVPRSLVDSIYRAAMDVASGAGKPMGQRRLDAIGWFVSQQHATQADVLLVLGREGIEDVTLKDLETLTALRGSVREGELVWEDVVREARQRAAPQREEAAPLTHAAGAHTDRGLCGAPTKTFALPTESPTCERCRRLVAEAVAAPAPKKPSVADLGDDPAFQDLVQKAYDDLAEGAYQRDESMTAEDQAERIAREQWAARSK